MVGWFNETFGAMIYKTDLIINYVVKGLCNQDSVPFKTTKTGLIFVLNT